MSDNLSEGKASPMEAEKLIEEMQRLIVTKGLDVTLTEHHPRAEKLLEGCTQCTICPCMIGV